MNNSIEKAVTYLTNGIASGVWPKGTRMPTVMQLKKDAHVSKIAMLSAVKRLKEAAVLSVSRKSGIYVAGPSTYSVQQQPIIKWQIVRRRILQDILEKKILVRGKFPSVAEIRLKYGASFRSCKKALESLIAEKTIEHDSRGYRVTSVVVPTSTATIALYSIGNDDGQIKIYNTRIHEFLAQLQRSCIEADIALVLVGLKRTPEPESINTALPQGTFGAVVCISGLSPENIQAVITQYNRQKLPVALFDELGAYVLPPPVISNQRLKIFTIAAKKAGNAIGDFLLRAGHRKIAYFAGRFRDLHWSKMRLQGLIETFNKAGLDGGVIDSMSISDGLSVVSTQKGLTDFPGINPALHQKSIADLEACRAALHDIIRRWEETYFNNRLLNPAHVSVWTTVEHEKVFHRLLPAMSTILADSGISAWVGDNDMLAHSLKSFLAKVNIDVPPKIALVGFDNSLDSYDSQLTSYDFDITGIAHKIVQYIINPCNELFLGTDTIECEGMVMARKTTQTQ